MTASRALLALCLAGMLASCSRVERLDLRTLGRDMWQRPNDVVAALAITPGSTVADLAPGARVVVIEPDAELGGILGLFVKPEHASRAAHVLSEMREAGYQHRASYDILPVQLVLGFSAPAR